MNRDPHWQACNLTAKLVAMLWASGVPFGTKNLAATQILSALEIYFQN